MAKTDGAAIRVRELSRQTSLGGIRSGALPRDRARGAGERAARGSVRQEVLVDHLPGAAAAAVAALAADEVVERGVAAVRVHAGSACRAPRRPARSASRRDSRAAPRPAPPSPAGSSCRRHGRCTRSPSPDGSGRSRPTSSPTAPASGCAGRGRDAPRSRAARAGRRAAAPRRRLRANCVPPTSSTFSDPARAQRVDQPLHRLLPDLAIPPGSAGSRAAR